MRLAPVKTIVANNLTTLMAAHGDLILDEVAKLSGVGRGTVARIRKGEVACGIDTLAQIAAVFNLQAWQLLIPNIDPENPPRLRGNTPKEREFYRFMDAVLEKDAK